LALIVIGSVLLYVALAHFASASFLGPPQINEEQILPSLQTQTT